MADEKTKTTEEKPGPAPPADQKQIPGGGREVALKPDAPPPDPSDDPSDPPETRQDRRNARAAFKQAEEAKAEAARYRDEALLAKARLDAQQVHIEGLKAVLPPQPTQVDRQLEEVGRQQEALLKGWQGRQATLKQGETIPEEETSRTRAEWQRLADTRARLIAQSVAPQMTGPSQQQIQAMISEAQLRAKYADVYADEGAVAYANALAGKYQREGLVGPAAVERVMQETRQKLGLGKSANGHSQAADNARFAGVPMGAPPMKSTPGHYKMSAAEEKMARAQFNKDPPEVAYEKWANSTGKKLLRKSSS